MKSLTWIKILVSLILIIIISVCSINYIVDPYNLYKTNLLKNKPKEFEYMRLVKAINVEEIKPYSIVLGTSRAEMAIDPEHEYFIKPSYNLANAGSTMYETKYYLKEAILQGKLKKVLLVADWRMFNDVNMKQVADFETYFENRNIYKYLLNYKVFEDSLFTIKNQNKLSLHKSNGQMTDRYVNDVLLAHGGQYKTMLAEEKNYYKNFTNNNSYKDTKKDSFEDFKEILQMCYRNNIKLDIIFGPSHIRQWEAFDYYHGYETFLKWKKDIVLFVEKIGLEENKIPFNILDFSVYHRLTAENVPKEPEQRMEFHFEGSHYTNKLGLIVLDRLSNNSLYNDFGVYINSSNIDNHLENLRKDRLNFIDIKEYRKEVFGE
ncbi:hypothetical protein [Aliarcobacter cryaerophilus]|jgi:hypothetical protein|uniref:hypothetical protein n=2 Tax=Aliarcobacter cryaerophilus TaxID=28198 RepID=UPI000EAC347D|nr:hypothetical protein [Aliarcobacter cryaerophilus]AYJ77660.1 hypothetical protein ACRYD_0501 [Aliarcobacter cryaerophilus D2610]QNM92774.1 hypothetical protein HOO33_02770 [Aliarcobacter cryaerophilus]